MFLGWMLRIWDCVPDFVEHHWLAPFVTRSISDTSSIVYFFFTNLYHGIKKIKKKKQKKLAVGE